MNICSDKQAARVLAGCGCNSMAIVLEELLLMLLLDNARMSTCMSYEPALSFLGKLYFHLALSFSMLDRYKY